MKTLLLIAFLLASTNTFAEVYRELGNDGQYHYKSSLVEAPNSYPVTVKVQSEPEPEKNLRNYLEGDENLSDSE